MDLENPDAHGEYLVELVTDELVGTKSASAIVVSRPGTRPEEVPFMKANVSDCGKKIILSAPSKVNGCMLEPSKWIKVLADNQNTFHMDRTVQSMQTTVTKLTQKTSNNEPRMKTTTIDITGLGFTLSNEYFSPGHVNNHLMLLPIPCKRKLKDENNVEYTDVEINAIWRAFIEDSEQDVLAAAGKNDAVSLLKDLLQNSKV